MKEKKENGLMKYVRDLPFEHVLLNGGDDGQAFLCFRCEPEQIQPYEKELLRLAKEVERYENAYFCPDPESHINDIKKEIDEEWESITVLNLFR